MDRDVRRQAGLRLRERREERGWRREEVAQRAQLSVSLLAQFERGEANPSLTSLAKMADAVGMTLAELVASEDTGATLARLEPTVMWRGSGGSRSVLLAGASGRGETELWRYDVAPGDAYEGDAHLPRSEVLIHVLEGTLELTVDDEVTSVVEGESVRLGSDVAHAYANGDAQPLTFFLVYTRPSKQD